MLKVPVCAFPVYCFMPDHLHILAEGRDQGSDLKKFISVFKQRTSFNFKKGDFQKSYCSEAKAPPKSGTMKPRITLKNA